METRIISAFPASGKTWMFNNTELLVADSDSSNFSWVYTSKGKIRNPDFPDNYIKYIKSLIGTVDYILVSSHEEVRKALEDSNLPYVLVVPSHLLKLEWIGRCYLRGNTPEFIKLIDINWGTWTSIESILQKSNPTAIIILNSREYLKDVIYKLPSSIALKNVEE